MNVVENEGGSVSKRETASRIARSVRRGRYRFYRASDFSGTRSAVEKALSRLVEEGELLRVRNGLYWRGSKTPLGMSPPNPREVVYVYAEGIPIGPAGLSAANYLGLTTQVPRIPEYAVPATVPDVDRIRLHRRMGRRSEARRRARLSELEVAFLEVLDAWDDIVELPAIDAVARLGELVESGSVDVSKIVRASTHEPARGRSRLKAILESLGRPEDARAVRECSKPSVRIRALKPIAGALNDPVS